VVGQLAQLQAVLTRTYALANVDRHREEDFDLCSTTHCQVYRPAEDQPPGVRHRVGEAGASTAGLIVTDGTGPIQALYHADCGGATSSATAVWGGPAPHYLLGVQDHQCRLISRENWSVSLTHDHLRRILNTTRETAVGAWLDRIEIVRRDPAGRATEVALLGQHRQQVRGERLRSVISRQLGARSFRSARFSVLPRMNEIEFRGQGFGHGVGLCQRGAIARVREGYPIDDVLQHYYPGTWLAPYREFMAT